MRSGYLEVVHMPNAIRKSAAPNFAGVSTDVAVGAAVGL